MLRALARRPVEYTPVWVMRQAGRYLPEYRQLRARAADFLTLCKTPEYACEATLQPVRRFPLDAAILFSDILVIPDAMGLGLEFAEGRGPSFSRPVRRGADVRRLSVPDPEESLGYVLETVRRVCAELDGRIPLIGFAGSPWTLAAYMVQGHGGDFLQARALLYEAPALLHEMLERLAEAAGRYLAAQASAGAQALMIFDTWGGLLTEPAYEEFSLAYIRRTVEHARAGCGPVPIIVFGKGAGSCLERIAACGCDAVGLDWTVHLGRARERIGGHVALQGNLDPAVLLAPPAAIRAAVARTLEEYGPGPGHVFNLGHGIAPEVAPEHVGVLVEAVQEFSRPYHRPPDRCPGGEDKKEGVTS